MQFECDAGQRVIESWAFLKSDNSSLLLLDLTVVCARLGRDKVAHSPLRTDPKTPSSSPICSSFCFVLYMVFITYPSSAHVW